MFAMVKRTAGNRDGCQRCGSAGRRFAGGVGSRWRPAIATRGGLSD